MNLAKRVLIFVLGCSALTGARLWLDHVALPQVAAETSVASVNESDAHAARTRLFGVLGSTADDALILLPALLAAACFARPVIDALRGGDASKGNSHA